MNYIDEGNPSDWNGINPLCKECGEKEIEMNDCCGANIDKDRGHCYQCKDNSETSLDSYCEEYKVEVVNDKLKKVK